MIRPILRAMVVASMLAAAALAMPGHATASAPPNAIAVLDREAQFLAAIAKGDAKAFGAMLAEKFVHTDYQGKVVYREGAIAALSGEGVYRQKPSEQTVDFAGNVAVVHGLDTVTRAGAVVLRLRYTDVYVNTGKVWKVLSAQETPVLAK